MTDLPLPIRTRWLTTGLFVAVLLAAAGALVVGSVHISVVAAIRQMWLGLRGIPDDAVTAQILLSVRLPRIVLAISVGAAMGLSGLAAQTLFRNPLASPYVMGISNGAAVGAVIGMLLVGRNLGYAAIPLFSTAAGLMAATGAFVLARRSGQFAHSLLLAGIAISAFCSAITAAALYLAGERLGTLVFWLMGGLWQATWRDALIMTPVGIASLLALLLLAPSMNVALLGERSAHDLGVHIGRLQVLLLIVVAVTTSVAVSLTGVIGFVGLVVPHVLRLLMGADHRRLVPASAAGGALLLLLPDTAARTAAAPAEVPVGIVTALLGAPIFLWQIQRRGRLALP